MTQRNGTISEFQLLRNSHNIVMKGFITDIST